MLRSIILVCFVWFSSSNLYAAPQILVMGDSLSAGYGIAAAEAWPQLLAQRLKTQGYPYTVVNASISGETSAGGRSRLAAELTRTQPAIVVIALGANDGLRGLSLTAMRENLDAMILAAQKARATVLLVGMRLPPNFGTAYTKQFQQNFTDLARLRKTALVPFLLEAVATDRSLFQDDELHPTRTAQPMILDTVWKGLQPLLKKK